MLPQKEYKRDLELEVKGRGLNAMANETPDFMRAKNATDIASQVSVTIPCQPKGGKSDYKDTVLSFYYLTWLINSHMSIVAFLNICLMESILIERAETLCQGFFPSVFLSL